MVGKSWQAPAWQYCPPPHSQPLPAIPSQSVQPEEQVTIEQDPPEHVDWLTWGKEQTLPHAPQLDGLLQRFASHPLEIAPSQSPNPCIQGPIWH